MNKEYKNKNYIFFEKNSTFIIFIICYIIFIVLYIFFQIFSINGFNIIPESDEIIKEDIIVTKDIKVIDELKTEEEKKIFLQDIPSVYNIYDSVFYRQWNSFDRLFKFISSERPIPDEISKYIINQTDLNLVNSRIIPILIIMSDNDTTIKLFRNFLYTLYSKGISNLNSSQLINNSKNVVYVDWYRQFDTIRKEVSIDTFICEDNKDIKIDELYNQIFKGTIFDQNLLNEERLIFYEFIKKNLKENLVLDQLQSDELKNTALSNFTPKTINISAGTIIIRKGERVNPEIKRLLILIRKSLKNNQLSNLFSSLILLVFIGLIISFYLFSFSTSFKLYRRYSVYFFILIYLSFFFYILYELKTISFIPAFFIFPLLLFYLLIEFAYSINDRVIVYLSFIFILFVIIGFDYILLLYGLMLFTALSFFPLQAQSYKKAIFTKIMISMVVTTLYSLSVNLIFSKSFNFIELLFSGIFNIVFSMVLFFGLTPILENIFNFPTASKLLEICDLNNSFFSDFMLKAPGTYHHSVIVATLAEKAAANCNANPYIAKAGGLYHDIGKIRYSKYFIENQHGENPTVEVLNPNMAVTIIKNHVKFGISEAKKLRLPKEVIDIIEQHHGTSLISYFYVKALEKKKENVEKINFCYNYPKPKSKEAAIIMIVDAVEAASRTLKNTDKKSIEKIVSDVISNKSKDGQLEESPLTLKDLSSVQNILINNLYSMFHNRINYPDEYELKKLEEENR